MQRIAKTNKHTEEIINEIKKNISELVKLQDSKHENFEKLKKTVDKLQNDIKNLENNKGLNNKKDEEIIKQRVFIKRKDKSESFLKWIFNNNEV